MRPFSIRNLNQNLKNLRKLLNFKMKSLIFDDRSTSSNPRMRNIRDKR